MKTELDSSYGQENLDTPPSQETLENLFNELDRRSGENNYCKNNGEDYFVVIPGGNIRKGFLKRASLYTFCVETGVTEDAGEYSLPTHVSMYELKRREKRKENIYEITCFRILLFGGSLIQILGDSNEKGFFNRIKETKPFEVPTEGEVRGILGKFPPFLA